MSVEQNLALVIRVGAACVWLAYLARTSRRELRLHEITVVVLVAMYAGAQAYRAIVAPLAIVSAPSPSSPGWPS